MKFTDELRKTANESVVPSKRTLTPKEQAEADKKEAISRGKLSNDFYEAMKASLLQEAKNAKMWEQLRGKQDNDNRHSFEIVYLPKEFERKDKEYRQNYRDAETEYDYLKGEEVPIRRSRKIQAYVDYYVPHKVFSKNECDLIQWQLARKLKEDGFHYSFTTKEFKRKICDGLGLLVPYTSFGYTLELTVWWDK